MSERVLLEAHAHTKEVSPCGRIPAAMLIDALASHGYGAVVITDHYEPGTRQAAGARDAFLDGWRTARAAGEEKGVVVLPGMEIRFKDRPEDYLVYGMEEADFAALPDNACEAGLSEFHVLARERGWLVYQAHPFRPKQLPANPAFLEGMEVFNGNPRHESQNRMAGKYAMLHNLRTIAGSDVHRPGDVGIVGLLVPRDVLTPKGFSKWLSATPHPRIEYQETPVDGIRYVCGAIPGQKMLEALYTDAGWTSYTQNMEESLAGISSSPRIVTAWDDTSLVGMARAITDEHTILLVQDILVLGAYRRRGIGRELTRRLLMPYRNIRQTLLITDSIPQTRAFCAACGFETLDAYQCTGYIRLK